MEVQHYHDWQVTTDQAQRIQKELAGKVLRRNEVGAVHLVAGVDISAADTRGLAKGAVVVLRYPELTLVEAKVVEQEVSFPYVPGLLSFRESPLILAASQGLSLVPDLILVDGQGICHPRRLGLASHLGLLWDKPTIGCAKSRLCGHHQSVGAEAGCWAEVVDGDEVLGSALRTRAGAGPLYVSIGHKVDLASAIYWALGCCRGHRLPEPTRLAHLAAAGKLKDRPVREEIPGEGYQGRLMF